MDSALNYFDCAEGNQAYFDDSVHGGSPQTLPCSENSNNQGDQLENNKHAIYINKDPNNSSESTIDDVSTTYYGDNIIKGQWTPQEDKKLIDLVKKHGKKWSKIASEFKTRTGKQCRERWIYHHQPGIKDNKDWSKEDEEILIDAHREHGNKWSTISKLLPGRTDNAIKNYFNKTLRTNQPKKNKSKPKPKPKTLLQQYIAGIPEYNRQIKSPSRRENSGKMIEQNNEGDKSKYADCNTGDLTFAQDKLPVTSTSSPSTNYSSNELNVTHVIDGTNHYENGPECIVWGSDINAANPNVSENMNEYFTEDWFNPLNMNEYFSEEAFNFQNIDEYVTEKGFNSENVNEYFSEEAFIPQNTNECLTKGEPTQPVVGSGNNDNSAGPSGTNLPSQFAGINWDNCYSPQYINEWCSFSPQYFNEWDICTGSGQSSGQSTTVQDIPFVNEWDICTGSGQSSGQSTTVRDVDAECPAGDGKGKGKMPGYV